MRSTTATLLCASGLAALALLAPGGPSGRAVAQDLGLHGDEGRVDDPRALFREQCASCHVTPDPRVATDLAFIRQLQETA